MIIGPGGDLSCSSATVGGAAAGATGEVVISAGVFSDADWSIAGNLKVGGSAPATLILQGIPIAGLFSFAGAKLTVLGQLTVDAGGIIAGNGTLAALNRDVINGGIIAPGLSPGVITIEGDYEQTPQGTLVVEAAGLESGQFDVLHVTKTATLGGTLEVRFLDGFLPRQGDTMEFVQADGGINGHFATVTFPNLAPGFAAELQSGDDGRLRLRALNDAVAGEGMRFDPTTSAAQSLPSACGVGVCGTGFAHMLALTLVCVGAMRRRNARRPRSPRSLSSSRASCVMPSARTACYSPRI